MKPLLTIKAFLRCTTAAKNQCKHLNSAQIIAGLHTGTEEAIEMHANYFHWMYRLNVKTHPEKNNNKKKTQTHKTSLAVNTIFLLMLNLILIGISFTILPPLNFKSENEEHCVLHVHHFPHSLAGFKRHDIPLIKLC